MPNTDTGTPSPSIQYSGIPLHQFERPGRRICAISPLRNQQDSIKPGLINLIQSRIIFVGELYNIARKKRVFGGWLVFKTIVDCF